MSSSSSRLWPSRSSVGVPVLSAAARLSCARFPRRPRCPDRRCPLCSPSRSPVGVFAGPASSVQSCSTDALASRVSRAAPTLLAHTARCRPLGSAPRSPVGVFAWRTNRLLVWPTRCFLPHGRSPRWFRAQRPRCSIASVGVVSWVALRVRPLVRLMGVPVLSASACLARTLLPASLALAWLVSRAAHAVNRSASPPA